MEGTQAGSGRCNGCANHCPVHSMQCARGLKLMGMDSLDSQIKQKKPRNRNDSLGSMLRACSNKLFIGGKGDEFFNVLSGEEKDKLADYLDRLLNQ